MVGGPSVHQIAGGVTQGERSCSRVGTRGATVVTRQEPGNSDVKPTRRKIGAFLPCEDTHGRTMYVYSIDRSCVFFCHLFISSSLRPCREDKSTQYGSKQIRS
jgi:hypothetical protein